MIAEMEEMCDLDTSMRIKLLCDGDEFLKNPMLSLYRKEWTIRELQLEYSFRSFSGAVLVAAEAIGNAFNSALERTTDMLTELLEGPYSLMEDFFLGDTPKWYRPKIFTNYRKIRFVAVRTIMRCRWRPRESRRSLAGLSPHAAILDGDTLEEGIS